MPQVGAALFAGFSTFGSAAALGAGAVAAGLGVSTAFSIGAFFATVGGRLLLSVSISALSSALNKEPKIPVQGIRTESTTSGGSNPATFNVGKYATEGNLSCQRMSHGTNNYYHTLIVDLSDLPISALNRISLDGEWSGLGSTPHPDYGLPILSKQTSGTKAERLVVEGDHDEHPGYEIRQVPTTNDHAWVKFYDGTQTVADPMLLDRYSSHPNTPWSDDMVGVGVAYAIVTLALNRNVFTKIPDLRFELDGISLYDPRLDSSIGGSGTHIWADPSTWESSDNPMVQIYNIARGITLPNGRVWGGGFEAKDLPLSNWFAAMNECDLLVTDGDVGTELQYLSGFEISVDMEPAAVMEEIGKACSAKFVEDGGKLMTRCGPAPLPSMYFTDEDILMDHSASRTPFPELSEVYNGVRATYPEPEELWSTKDAPGIYDAALQLEDAGQENVADLSFTTVYRGSQVQRLINSWLSENRRFLRHALALGAAFIPLQPLDVVAWTSDTRNYPSKSFEIGQVVRASETLTSAFGLREVDPSDFTPVPANIRPVPINVPAVIVPPAIAFEGINVSAITIIDELEVPRRPAIEVTYTPNEQINGVSWVVYLQGDLVPVGQGSSRDSGHATISEGLLPGQTYDLILTPIADGPTLQTIVNGVQVDDVRLGYNDLADEVTDAQVVVDAELTSLNNDITSVRNEINKNFHFNDGTNNWTGFTTDQPLAGSEYSQGGAIRCTGRNDVFYGNDIPVDRGRIYRLRARVRNDGSIPTIFFAGVATKDINGDIETSIPGAHRYCTALNETIPPDGQWYEFTGEITGAGATTNQFRPTTVTVQPMALLNYLIPNGIMTIDYLEFEDIDDISEIDARVTTLDVDVGNNAANVTIEQAARIGGDSNLALQVTSLTTSFNQTTAALTVEQAARIAEDSVLASEIATNSASIGGLSATVSNQSAAIATLDGFAQASAGLNAVVVTENGTQYIAGFRATSFANPNGSGGAVLEFNGLAIFNNALQSDNFNGTISAAGIITDPGTIGWAIDAAGMGVFNALIDRSWLQAGVISDGGDISVGSLRKSAGEVIGALENLGPATPNQFWHYSASITLQLWRTTVTYSTAGDGGGPITTTTTYRSGAHLQFRGLVSGVWENWTTLHTTSHFAVAGTAGKVDHIDVFQIQNGYEDMQMRWIAYITPDTNTTNGGPGTGSGPTTDYNNIMGGNITAGAWFND